jgi:hypothetical protein
VLRVIVAAPGKAMFSHARTAIFFSYEFLADPLNEPCRKQSCLVSSPLTAC